MYPGEVSVIGAGAWGTAIAQHIAGNSVNVLVWAYEKEVVKEINDRHTNSVFLPGFKLN
ncbi:MAG: glycerol-3-phosphate dehydrogenase, partial [Nitrospinota bacterium]